MNIRSMKLSAWLCIATALLSLPIILLTVYSEFSDANRVAMTALEMISNAVYLAMFVVIFSNFKYLLNRYHNTNSANLMISLVIWGNIILTSLSIITMAFRELDGIVGMISTFSLIPYGIIHTLLGFKILKLDTDLYGWRKSFSIFTIITGITFATVILIPVGLITSMISDALLAVIFFKAAAGSAKTAP